MAIIISPFLVPARGLSHSFSFKFLVVCSYVCRLFQLIANLGARIPVNDTVGVVSV